MKLATLVSLLIAMGTVQLFYPTVILVGAPRKETQVTELLEPIRVKHKLPALAGAIATSERIVAIAATGMRKAGTSIPVTVNDQFHLGSNTKAVTATLIAALVEQGKLRWESTIALSFPELAESMAPELESATLLQLLSHRAGLPANIAWHAIPRTGDLRSMRETGLNAALKKVEYQPGSRYQYSNVGYFVAGVMAERAGKMTWEDLVRKFVFVPLGMTNAGFGGLGTPGTTDQPWPHQASGNPMPSNGPEVDNHPALGPAGTVHCTMTDWSRFAQDQLRGARGSRALLKPASYKTMHKVHFGGDYALGWIRTPRGWGGGEVLTHAGDNTMNHAVIWLAPERDFAVLIATNQGGDRAHQACDEAAAALIALQTRG